MASNSAFMRGEPTWAAERRSMADVNASLRVTRRVTRLFEHKNLGSLNRCSRSLKLNPDAHAQPWRGRTNFQGSAHFAWRHVGIYRFAGGCRLPRAFSGVTLRGRA